MENGKKYRGVNFKAEEKQVLIDIIYKYRDILENKKTDGSSIKEKELAWEKVAIEFNSTIAICKRSEKQLKGFYENMKRRAKKKNTEDRLNLFKTGGGAEVKSTLDSTEVQVLSIIKGRVDPLPNPFDSDANLYTTIDFIPEPSCSSEVLVIPTPLDSSNLEEETVQDTGPENTTSIIDINEATPVTPTDRLKIQTSDKWKSRNRPVIKKYKRSEASEVRENLCELSQTRKELLNLQIEQAKEKHAQEMLNLQMQAEALNLQILYYKNKLAICKND